MTYSPMMSVARAGAAGQRADPGPPWSRQSYLELGALPTAVSCARLHTTLVLWEWGLGALAAPRSPDLAAARACIPRLRPGARSLAFSVCGPPRRSWRCHDPGRGRRGRAATGVAGPGRARPARRPSRTG